MNLGELRTHFLAVLNRSDITTALANTFIINGIQRIQRSLRVPIMERQLTYTFSVQTGAVTLPADFLEAIEVYSGDKVLQRLPARQMLMHQAGNAAGEPYFFRREGVNLILYPEPVTGELSINYYAEFEPMTADTDENSLATVASDLIIYAALTYASDYYLDERAAIFDGKYREFMVEVQEQANDEAATGVLQVIQPAYTY